MWAARQGHLRIVKMFVRQCEGRVNFSAKDKAGFSALSGAAQDGRLDVVKYLVSLGKCRPNTLSRHDVTAVLHAVTQGDLEMVQRVLTVDAVDASIPDATGRSALIQATFKGNVKMMETLLEVGRVDVNHQNSDGMTALMTAASHGLPRATQTLVLSTGVDRNLRDTRGVSALMHAVIHDFLPPVVILLTSPDTDVNLCDRKGSTPLMQACAAASDFLLDELLAVPALDINLRDNAGSPAWVYGCEFGRTDKMVKSIVSRPATDCTSWIHYWETPLVYALRRNNLALARALLARRDVSPNACDMRANSTPMSWAVKYENVPMMEVLKSRTDCKRDERDDTTHTPLLRASMQSFTPGVQALLDVEDAEVEAERASGAGYRVGLVEARAAQAEADRVAALPPESESEGEGGDIDDSDEENEWGLGSAERSGEKGAGAGADAAAGSAVTSELDSLADSDSLPAFGAFKIREDGDGEEKGMAEEESDEEEEEKTGPAVPFYKDVFSLSYRPTLRAERLRRTACPAVLSTKDRWGWTPLTWAAHNGSLDTVLALLTQLRQDGQDVPIGPAWLYQRHLLAHRTNDFDAALMWAVKEDHLPVVKALTGIPCLDTQALDAKGVSVLVVATRQRQLNHIKALVRCPQTNTDFPDPDGFTCVPVGALCVRVSGTRLT